MYNSYIGHWNKRNSIRVTKFMKGSSQAGSIDLWGICKCSFILIDEEHSISIVRWCHEPKYGFGYFC